MGLLQTTSTLQKPQIDSTTPLGSVEEFPIPAYQFSIEIGDVVVAFFQSISGLAVSREVEPLKVGGLNNHAYEFPGQITYGHVTFELGLTSSDFFYKWMLDGQYSGRAALRNFTLVQRRPNPKGSKPIFEEVKRWNFINTFPVSWKITDLNIKDSQSIVLESLELAFEYFEPGA